MAHDDTPKFGGRWRCTLFLLTLVAALGAICLLQENIDGTLSTGWDETPTVAPTEEVVYKTGSNLEEVRADADLQNRAEGETWSMGSKRTKFYTFFPTGLMVLGSLYVVTKDTTTNCDRNFKLQFLVLTFMLLVAGLLAWTATPCSKDEVILLSFGLASLSICITTIGILWYGISSIISSNGTTPETPGNVPETEVIDFDADLDAAGLPRPTGDNAGHAERRLISRRAECTSLGIIFAIAVLCFALYFVFKQPRLVGQDAQYIEKKAPTFPKSLRI